MYTLKDPNWDVSELSEACKPICGKTDPVDFTIFREPKASSRVSEFDKRNYK